MTIESKPNSQIIIVRHGATEYTGNFPDITESGEKQIQETAEQLRENLSSFRYIQVLSSPAARAQGSAEKFKSHLGLDYFDLQIEPLLAPMQIKDLSRFLRFDAAYSTPVYGEMFLNNPYLGDENDLIEGRRSIRSRAFKFLKQSAAFAQNYEKISQDPICIVAFTHFEIAAFYLEGLYKGQARYPSAEAPSPQNGEALIIELQRDPKVMRLQARGSQRLVKPDYTNNRFTQIKPPLNRGKSEFTSLSS